VVAAGKALIDLERSDPRSWESDAAVKQAREKFGRRIEAIAARQAAALARGGLLPYVRALRVSVRGRVVDGQADE
jgi:hypothetical protein